MPLSSTDISLYSNERRILDAIVAAGGGTYTLPSPQAATKWRARAYMFRKLFRDLAAEKYANLEGFVPTTPYDNLVMTIEKGSPAVIIRFRSLDGELTDLSGAKLEPASVSSVTQTDPVLDDLDSFLSGLDVAR